MSDADVVLEITLDSSLGLAIGYERDGELVPLASDDAGRVELHRGDKL